MKKRWQKKSIVLMILLQFIGVSIIPCINSSPIKIDDFSAIQDNVEKNIGNEIIVPDCVEVGDLLLFDFRYELYTLWKIPGPYNEHAAIYIGNNTFIDATNPFVQMNDYSHYYHRQKNLVFLRVITATESQRLAAVDWAISKIGALYQDFYKFPWFGIKNANTNLSFPIADKYYCMELVWSAYYNQGIDIDQNQWKFPWWVTGNDILYDTDVAVIYQEIENSTEIIKPFKGAYLADKKIISTLDKTIIFGPVTIEAVTYNDKVTSMDFYLDSVYQATDSTAPYTWTWSEQSQGRVVVKAVACDNEGNHYSTRIVVQKIF